MERLEADLRAHMQAAYGADAPRLVLGEGARGARVMLVGEAPGTQEAREGRPFVGQAGKNLNRFLELAGLERAQLYITNAVKFRPERMGKSGRTVNRTPTMREIGAFIPFLQREIRLLRPGLIVTLGNVPLYAVTGERLSVGDVHGRVLPVKAQGTAVFPLYHPASILYNRALTPVYERDVRALGALCALQGQNSPGCDG